jgi:ATP-dependent helicase/nuclease subunit A
LPATQILNAINAPIAAYVEYGRKTLSIINTKTQVADIKQREQALCLSKSFIVSAPAGSGKTSLLIERYLCALAASKEGPQEVLAITFTKKAAAEMRARLLDTLKNPDEKNPKIRDIAKQVIAISKKKSWNILQFPEKIRICTIDSLCHEIALLSETNVIENLNISEDPEQLYISAINDMLSNYNKTPWQQTIIEVLDHTQNDFEKLQKLLIEMLKSRDIWLPLISSNNNEQSIREIIEASIKNRNGNITTLLLTHFPKELLASAKNLFKMYLAAKSETQDIELLNNNSVNDWKLFADLILTSQNTVRKRANKDIGIAPMTSANNKQEKEALKLLKLEADGFFMQMKTKSYFVNLLIMLRNMPTNFYSDLEWLALKNIIQIMPIAAAYLNIAFEKHAECDFTAINLACMEALGPANSHSDLAINISHKISHILVDEFQDTSLSQLALLKKLTVCWDQHDGKSLFLVGDPMQSIYKFRQADVAIFLSLIDNNLGNIKLNHLNLTVNFRSTNKIVDWVNSLFSKLFSKNHIPNSGQVIFSKAISHTLDNSGGVDFNITLNSDENYQHELIATQIKQLLPTTTSIAILVRSRNHLHELSPMLDKHNIPYIQEDIIPLVKLQAAIDIAHLYIALTNFSNKISWLSLLASPLCGLQYQSIHTIASNAKTLTIWEAAGQDNNLPEEENNRIKYFLNIITHALQTKGSANNSLWLESTWISLGGPNFVSSESKANSISKLFNNLMAMGHNIPATWPQWQKLLARQYIANDMSSSTKVTIMTIHKAKGLEFDHVFLPSFNKKPPSHRSSLLNWSLSLQADNNLIISPISSDSRNKSEINNYLNYIAKLQNINEDIRVLYVAATRAKKHLYIYANAKSDNENNIIISNNNSFMHLTWAYLESNKNHNLNYFENCSTSQLTPQIKASSIITLEHLKNTSLYANTNSYESSCNPDFINAFNDNNYHTIRGIIIHKYIEKIANLKVNIADINLTKITSNLEIDIIESYVDRIFIIKMKKEIITILNNFIQTPFAAWILAPEHKRCRNEYAITIKTGNGTQNIIIDRTFIDQNNDRWIVDYKTTSEKVLDFATFSNEQKNKYYNQLSGYAQAFRGENRNIICCLYFIPLQKYLTFNI